MTKLIVVFRNIANAHKNDPSYRPVGYIELTIQYKIPRINYVARTLFMFLHNVFSNKCTKFFFLSLP